MATIMEAVNDMITAAGGTPTGNGGSIVDKLHQLETALGGTPTGNAGTIADEVKKVAELQEAAASET